MSAAAASPPAMNAPATGKTRQYSTFRVDDLLFGIEVVKVQEVVRYQELTVVPLAPSVVDGLINLRGQIVIAIDTRRCLGLPRAPQGSLPMNIVIKSEDGVVSLLVDEIGDVIDVPLAAYAAVPDNMPQMQKDLIDCVYVLREDGAATGRSGGTTARLMLVLNTAQVLESACR